jgi:hypothetical protein
MTEVLVRFLQLLLVLVPLLVVVKAQGQRSAAGSLRAAVRSYASYVFGFLGVILGMLVLEWLFVG